MVSMLTPASNDQECADGDPCTLVESMMMPPLSAPGLVCGYTGASVKLALCQRALALSLVDARCESTQTLDAPTLQSFCGMLMAAGQVDAQCIPTPNLAAPESESVCRSLAERGLADENCLPRTTLSVVDACSRLETTGIVEDSCNPEDVSDDIEVFLEEAPPRGCAGTPRFGGIYIHCIRYCGWVPHNTVYWVEIEAHDASVDGLDVVVYAEAMCSPAMMPLPPVGIACGGLNKCAAQYEHGKAWLNGACNFWAGPSVSPEIDYYDCDT